MNQTWHQTQVEYAKQTVLYFLICLDTYTQVFSILSKDDLHQNLRGSQVQVLRPVFPCTNYSIYLYSLPTWHRVLFAWTFMPFTAFRIKSWYCTWALGCLSGWPQVSCHPGRKMIVWRGTFLGAGEWQMKMMMTWGNTRIHKVIIRLQAAKHHKVPDPENDFYQLLSSII